MSVVMNPKLFHGIRKCSTVTFDGLCGEILINQDPYLASARHSITQELQPASLDFDNKRTWATKLPMGVRFDLKWRCDLSVVERSKPNPTDLLMIL